MKIKTITRHIPVSVIIFALLADLAFCQHDKDYLTAGRLDHENRITIGVIDKIHSDVLDEDRKILIYLPDDYMHSLSRYPVIYLLDGDYFFLPAAGIVEFLSKINRAPKMIVLAIVNTDRFRDFSPSPSGDAAKFSVFLKNELIPYMNKNYRTEPFNIFIGHSLGGLFVTHTLLHEPQLFDAYFAISPGLHWNSQSEVVKASEIINAGLSLDKYFFITYSQGDGDNIRSSTDKLINILETNAPNGLKWKFTFMPNDRHNSTPVRSTYDGLEFLFSRWVYLGENDAVKLIQHYKSLSEEFGFECKPTEDAAASIGRNLIRKGNIQEAIKIYQYIAEIYPLSADAYVSLGDLYLKMEDNRLAIENYRKALQLNPDNTVVQENMKKLGEEF